MVDLSRVDPDVFGKKHTPTILEERDAQEKEIQKYITSALRVDGSFFITVKGIPGTGKTLILNQRLGKSIRDLYKGSGIDEDPVYVDITLGDSTTVKNLLEKMYVGVRQDKDSNFKMPSTRKLSLASLADRLMEELASRYVVLVVDDFHNAVQPMGIYREFSRLYKEEVKVSVVLIFGGLNIDVEAGPPHEIFSTYPNYKTYIFDPYEVQGLEKIIAARFREGGVTDGELGAENLELKAWSGGDFSILSDFIHDTVRAFAKRGLELRDILLTVRECLINKEFSFEFIEQKILNYASNTVYDYFKGGTTSGQAALWYLYEMEGRRSGSGVGVSKLAMDIARDKSVVSRVMSDLRDRHWVTGVVTTYGSPYPLIKISDWVYESVKLLEHQLESEGIIDRIKEDIVEFRNDSIKSQRMLEH